ncbi:MAG: tyrosine-type recombinase/integrase [Actinobacteria bacterium]|nr:tyrosine-type recombinase/integrase [Actinomycetota bacterium]
MKRQKTKYPGVYFREQDGERIFYIRYRLPKTDGGFKQVEEVAGHGHRDAMTPAKASHIRAKRMHGDQLPNKERRAQAARVKKTWTISRLWEEYQKANPDRREKGMESLYSKYLDPHFGDKEPKHILVLDIDRLKRRELKDKSPQTVAHVLGLLRRIINFGMKRGLCPGPGFIIQLPRVSNQKTEDLTPEQMVRLLEVLSGHVIYQSPCRQGAYMMKLALLTGMRRSEMFKLTWDAIDWHRKNITLRDAKSGRDEIIPMSSYAERLLGEIQAAKSDSPYVFPGRGGGQLVDIKKQVNQIKAEAGLPSDFRPLHGLRHVFASMLVSNGVSLDVVSRLLTHKGQTVTHRYAHFEDGILRQAAELAGRIVEEVAGTRALTLQKGQA